MWFEVVFNLSILWTITLQYLNLNVIPRSVRFYDKYSKEYRLGRELNCDISCKQLFFIDKNVEYTVTTLWNDRIKHRVSPMWNIKTILQILCICTITFNCFLFLVGNESMWVIQRPTSTYKSITVVI